MRVNFVDYLIVFLFVFFSNYGNNYLCGVLGSDGVRVIFLYL